eukprot:4733410-Pleurochrysis_carterae.AAC.3
MARKIHTKWPAPRRPHRRHRRLILPPAPCGSAEPTGRTHCDARAGTASGGFGGRARRTGRGSDARGRGVATGATTAARSGSEDGL